MVTALPKYKKQMMSSILQPLSNKIILEKTNMLLQRIEEWKNSFTGLKGTFKFMGSVFLSFFTNYFSNFVAEEIKYYSEVFQVNERHLINKSIEVDKLLERYKDSGKYIKRLLVNKGYLKKENMQTSNTDEFTELFTQNDEDEIDTVFEHSVSFNKKNGQSDVNQPATKKDKIQITDSEDTIAKSDDRKTTKSRLAESITGSRKLLFRQVYANQVSEFLTEAVEDMQAACVIIVSAKLSVLF
jgi:succinate dehydrogenase flavin-adding protein (antitoxin of CptAB toxin-antitoxin module)